MSKKLVLNWDKIDLLIDKLVNEINNSNFSFSCITGIPRGGLIPAVLLSHKLNIPYITFESVRNFHPNNQKTILLVDDISDTGHTLMEYADLKTATLTVRNTSKLYPDYYAEEITDDSWIVFPWERIEADAIQDYLNT